MTQCCLVTFLLLYLPSSRQRVADSKNMERIEREMKKVEQQLAVTEEEHEKIRVINGAIKNKLIGEEDKALSSEESLKVRAKKTDVLAKLGWVFFSWHNTYFF